MRLVKDIDERDVVYAIKFGRLDIVRRKDDIVVESLAESLNDFAVIVETEMVRLEAMIGQNASRGDFIAVTITVIEVSRIIVD